MDIKSLPNVWLISFRRGIKFRQSSKVRLSENEVLIRWPISIFSSEVRITGSMVDVTRVFY